MRPLIAQIFTTAYIKCLVSSFLYNLFVNNAVKEILKLCPESVLVSLYKIPSFESVDDFLQKVATVRGKLKKGGIVDLGAAARIVLHDWNEGISHLCYIAPNLFIWMSFAL